MATQGYNTPAEIPRELDKWNWGAFFLNWIWGLGNGTFIALLMFVPLVNLVMIFVLGARGSAWAWKNRPWRDVEHFKRVQRAWAIWGLVSWIVVIGLFTGLFLSVFSLMKSSEPYQAAMAAVRADPEVAAALGDTITEGFFVAGSINFSGAGGEAEFSIPVQGTKASGVVTSRSVRSDGVWQMRYLALTPAGGERIVLIDAESAATGVGAT